MGFSVSGPGTHPQIIKQQREKERHSEGEGDLLAATLALKGILPAPEHCFFFFNQYSWSQSQSWGTGIWTEARTFCWITVTSQNMSWACSRLKNNLLVGYLYSYNKHRLRVVFLIGIQSWENCIARSAPSQDRQVASTISPQASFCRCDSASLPSGDSWKQMWKEKAT